jgi:asparagine synthase (glutamine-hydrolysing)
VVQAQRYSAGLRLTHADRYWAWASVGTNLDQLLMLSAPEGAARRAPLLREVTEGMGLNGVLAADFSLVMAGDMLPKADLMSMANSLEVRSPFFDYQLVDYVFGLPESYKLRATRLGGLRKRVLNDAVRPLLPELIYHRPKQGFEVPLAGWFRTALRSRVEREVGDVEFLRHQGIFRPEGVQQLWQVVDRGDNRKEEWTLWAFLVFQQFYRRYVGIDAAAAVPLVAAVS